MFLFGGAAFVIICVLGAYAFHGGHLGVLWQPAEVVIIFGSGVGAFVIGNTKTILGQIFPALGLAVKGSMFTKQDYLDLLAMQYEIFKMMRTKGLLELEAHIENPEESALFQKYPGFLKNHHAVHFLCDYLRMMTMGSENAHQMEDLMNEEIDIHHHERSQISSAVQNMADSMPALGIVAAVLGVIHTMGSINQPPEVLGKLIGAALVGTFLGILMSYGFIGPIANIIKLLYEAESRYFYCMKAGILAYMNGYAPAIAVEFARKSIDNDVRPTFHELEENLTTISSG